MPVTTAAPAPLTDPTRSPSPVADHQLTVALPYGLRTPQVARQITARWLAAYVAPASRMCNVVLIVSELVTNAIRHTREPCTLKLTLHGSRLDVAVADHGETLPETSSTWASTVDSPSSRASEEGSRQFPRSAARRCTRL